MSLLEVTELKKHFPLGNHETVKAVDGVSLTLDAGETLGLVGESGCGKSTLGRCILRLIEPSGGSVRFEGKNVLELRGRGMRDLRQQMQIVFQDPYASLDPRWRIGTILDEPLRIHGIAPKQERPAAIARLLSDVGLPADAAGRFPHEFSGGQRQRVGIARALAVQPRFLVADEPVSALDVSVRAQILNLLMTLQRDRGIAMLFVGHDLGVVRQISRRVAVMYLGKIVEEAPTDALYDNPRHPYTRALLSAIPSITEAGQGTRRKATVTGDVPSPVNLPSGCRFRTRCPHAEQICAEKEPDLIPLRTNAQHRSACHFADDLPAFQSPNQPAAPSGTT